MINLDVVNRVKGFEYFIDDFVFDPEKNSCFTHDVANKVIIKMLNFICDETNNIISDYLYDYYEKH